MRTRPYCADDHEQVIGLFYNTVHTVNASDYTEAQLQAWAPGLDVMKSDEALCDRLLTGATFVAEVKGAIVGFGTLKGENVFDLLYIHSGFQRWGAASLIADEVEHVAAMQGAQIITTDASITAKPFFEKRGYRAVKEQSVSLRGQFLTNYAMEKLLCVAKEGCASQTTAQEGCASQTTVGS